MAPSPTLLDRIATHLAEVAAAVPAEEIARDFLRLATPDSGGAGRLVRALLAGDARFEECASGAWRRAPRSAAALAPPGFLITIEVPAAAAREPWLWRVWGRPWRAPVEPPVCHVGLDRSATLETLLAALATQPVGTDRPGALRRWLGAQERLHGVPEREATIIDLRAWGRLLAPAAEVVRETPASAAEPDAPAQRLRQLEATWDEVVAAARERGVEDWQQIARLPLEARAAERERVWQVPRAFDREFVTELPVGPGVYRFLDREGQLLYVGKAKNLRRRVGSYFQPLDARSRRRAALLEQLHRLEFEVTGSELEALIQEMSEIRGRRPLWNVQIELRTSADIPLREQDLACLVPDSELLASLFLVSGERAALARIAPDQVPTAEELSRALRAFFADRQAEHGWREFAAPERELVRRWLSWAPETVTLLHLADFDTYQTVAAALLSAMLSGAGQSAERVEVRAAATPRHP